METNERLYERPASPLSPRWIGQRVLSFFGQTPEVRQRRAEGRLKKHDAKIAELEREMDLDRAEEMLLSLPRWIYAPGSCMPDYYDPSLGKVVKADKNDWAWRTDITEPSSFDLYCLPDDQRQTYFDAMDVIEGRTTIAELEARDMSRAAELLKG